MTQICSCNTFKIGNLGTPNCAPVAKETAYMILTPYIKNDGTIPKILATDTLDDTFWNTHIQRYNNAGALVASDERWYITPLLENPEDVRGDAVFEEFNSGNRAFVRDGVRTVTLMLPNISYGLEQNLDAFKCGNLGAWFVDRNGNIIGDGSVAGELRPLRINEKSWNVTYMPATGGNTVDKLQLVFDLHSSAFDCDRRMITATDVTLKVADLEPLIDVNGTLATSPAVTTTTFRMTFKYIYGSIKDLLPVRFLKLADFVLEEVSPTPATIAITSVTEVSNGVYDFVFPVQTSADVLKLTLKKVGLDGETIEDIVITIP